MIKPKHLGIEEIVTFAVYFENSKPVPFFLTRPEADRLKERAEREGLSVQDFIQATVGGLDWLLAWFILGGLCLYFNYFGDKDHDGIPDLFEEIVPLSEFFQAAPDAREVRNEYGFYR